MSIRPQLFTQVCFSFSGTLSHSKQFLGELVRQHGAQTTLKVTPGETTYLISTNFEYEHRTRQVELALRFNVPILREAFITESIQSGSLVSPRDYLIGASAIPTDLVVNTTTRGSVSLQDEEHFSNFELLSSDVFYHIFKFLPVSDLLLGVQPVCTAFDTTVKLIAQEESLWLAQINHASTHANGEVLNSFNFFERMAFKEYSDGKFSQELNDQFEQKKSRLLMTAEKFHLMTDRMRVAKESARQYVSVTPATRDVLPAFPALDIMAYSIRQRCLLDWRDSKYSAFRTGSMCLETLDQFLRSKRSQGHKELIIGSWSDDSGEDSSALFEWLGRHNNQLQDLKALFLGDIPQHECEVSWIQWETDLSTLLSGLPVLSHFTIKGSGGLSWSPITHNHLQSITVVTGGLGFNVVEGIWNSNLPVLQHLELWLGVSDYGADFEPNQLADLLTKEESGKFPCLEYLGIRNYENVDQICKALFESAIARRVRTIDLSLGMLGDAGVIEILKVLENNLNNDDFKVLETLNFAHNFITTPIAERLLALPFLVNLTDRDNPGERYVTVSE